MLPQNFAAIDLRRTSAADPRTRNIAALDRTPHTSGRVVSRYGLNVRIGGDKSPACCLLPVLYHAQPSIRLMRADENKRFRSKRSDHWNTRLAEYKESGREGIAFRC